MLNRINKQIGVGDVEINALSKKYINDVLKRERLTYGYYISQFEKKFAKIHEVKYAVFCNSGTSALQVAVHALKRKFGWQNDDEVIVPALTFVATVNIVLQNNLRPIFVDVDPLYFELDPWKLEKKITKKTKAIIPVHIGGHPADMYNIIKISQKYGLKVVEDSCETMFAEYKGKPVGSFSDISCFSTYAAHFLTTGVGGFACTNDPDLAVMIKSLFNHGRDGIYLSMDDDNVKNNNDLFNIVKKRFNFTDIGYSYRATELEGALGLAQLADWKTSIKKRKENALYLTKGLKNLSEYFQLPTVREDCEHVFMFYPIVIKDLMIKRNELIFFLEKNKIETRYLFPLLCQPIYKKLFGDIGDDYPVAKYLSENGFYIGCHPSLTKNELDYVIDKFYLFIKKINKT